MPRRCEPLTPGETYHVYNRGVDRQPIFRDASDYGTFLIRVRRYITGQRQCGVGETSPQGGMVVLAYCLMPNHYHLLVQPKSGALSHQMQLLGISFTKAFNRRHHRVGPLFQGRFRSVRVGSDSQLVWLSRYIHRNPSEGGLESHLGSWPYSSYPDYIGSRMGSIPSVELILELAGGREAYIAMMSDISAAPLAEISSLLIGGMA